MTPRPAGDRINDKKNHYVVTTTHINEGMSNRNSVQRRGKQINR